MKNFMWLVLCIYFEARGESLEGKIAVAHVIMNRVEKRDASIEAIVKAPYQFEWLNPGVKRPVLDDFDALSDCMLAAMVCFEERIDGKDFFGSDHYHGDYIDPPYWVPSMKKITHIDHHIFYKS